MVLDCECFDVRLVFLDENRPNTPNVANSWKNTKKMIFVKSSAQRGHSVGHWPLPEGYWPDAKAKTLVCYDTSV